MVAGLVQPADDLCISRGVERGIGNDLLVQFGGHAAAARERQEHPTGREQPEREPVEVLVGTCPALHLGLVVHQFRRVEDHEVECGARVPESAQLGECVGLHEAAGRQAVRSEVLGGDAERGARGVDGGDLAGTALPRGNAERPRVCEDVEHLLAASECPYGGPALTLVEVEAGLVTAAHVDEVGRTVLAHLNAFGWLHPAEQARALGEALALSNLHVAAFVDRGNPVEREARIGDRIPPAVRADPGEFHNRHGPVPVDDHPGQVVALGEHEPRSGGAPGKVAPARRSTPHPVCEELGVDHVLFHERPDADRDLGVRAVGAPGKKGAIARNHPHRVTGRCCASNRLHGPCEHPRMPPPERSVLARVQAYHGRRHAKSMTAARSDSGFEHSTTKSAS
ncbi:unannotated protein [freshwater metagenome]|uniref:Unannotated protein n=1 Tax=freshwater metagenome TaxID=449393 RepID=A0A6J7DZY5_9ZZZZ